MKELREHSEITERDDTDQLAKLIRKLRWIGMEEEARRLELEARSLPSGRRGTVFVDPLGTD